MMVEDRRRGEVRQRAALSWILDTPIFGAPCTLHFVFVRPTEATIQSTWSFTNLKQYALGKVKVLYSYQKVELP